MGYTEIVRRTIFIFIFLLFFLAAGEAKAQVLINEISPNSNPEWVELYNTENVSIDISGWQISELSNPGNSPTENFYTIPQSNESVIAPHTWYVYYFSSAELDDSRDRVSLYRSDGILEDKSMSYGSEGNVCEPLSGQSVGRVKEGNTIERFSTSTIGATNDALLNRCPTPTPIPKAKATYTINIAKDENGVELYNVPIYINGDPSHHYAPQTFEFCDSGCDDGGFSYYEFELRKDGYETWKVGDVIKSGESYGDVNPVLVKIKETALVSNTSTPTPTPIKTPLPSPKNTGDPYITFVNDSTGSAAFDDSLVLGISEDTSPSPSPKPDNKKFQTILSWILIILGLTVMSGGGYYFYISFKKEITRNEKKKEVSN